jgi:hypothetical protein
MLKTKFKDFLNENKGVIDPEYGIDTILSNFRVIAKKIITNNSPKPIKNWKNYMLVYSPKSEGIQNIEVYRNEEPPIIIGSICINFDYNEDGKILISYDFGSIKESTGQCSFTELINFSRTALLS